MGEEKRKNSAIMNLKKANCRNCYKCVRACPVKAIVINNDQARIAEKLCIYCGKCYLVCPQDARELIGDLQRVKMMVESGEKVYVSISSAYPTYFPGSNIRRIATALKKLGITHVEETAIGTNRVMKEYTDIIESGSMPNLISTLCPASNFLIQKYFPQNIKWMIPVATPLEAHAKMMRKAYGDDIKVVGIGPCIAYHKLADLTDDGNLIDAYVNYEELTEWMNEKNIKVTDEEDADTYAVSDYRARYPDESGGLFRALPSKVKYKYTLWTADGVTRVAGLMNDLNSRISGYCIDVMACTSSCLGGPMVRLDKKDTFEGKAQWLESIKEVPEYIVKKNPSEDADVDIHKVYERMDFKQPEPTEEEIKELLALVGKTHKEDMLDCSGCGYPTCRDKAIAVYRGMADPFMCIPHARDKAEAQSNLLFDYSPNGVVVLDSSLKIVEINQVASKILEGSMDELKGRTITEFADPEFFNSAMMKETVSKIEDLHSPQLSKVLKATFFKIDKHNIFILIMDDITEEYERLAYGRRMRDDTINVTQEVVEKQMRIAQEIASLLGETTAETKLALNKLKSSLEEKDESGWH